MNNKGIITGFLVGLILVGCSSTNEKSATDVPRKEKGIISQDNTIVKNQAQTNAEGTEKKQLTIEIVKELSKKGENLVIEDFKNYIGTEIGSGLHIVQYPIDNNLNLLVGSATLNGKPLYVHLNKDGGKSAIDIRTGNIDEFLKK